MKTYHHILTIAGSDSCGGAGIEADIKTISALGCYASVAITAVTAQNTLGVRSICKVTPDVVADQIAAVMDDLHPQAIKIGMVNDAETIRAIATTLCRYPLPPMIIDPVMVSTSGSRLMEPDALSLFQATLLPLSTLLTPNIPEAELLAGRPIHGLEDMKAAARQIQQMGPKAVLVKGGHGQGREKTDLLLIDGSFHTFSSATISTRNTHGTGCTLSSAIASFVARGQGICEAVASAKAYLYEALRAGADVSVGEGHGPVNHFYDPQPLILTEQ